MQKEDTTKDIDLQAKITGMKVVTISHEDHKTTYRVDKDYKGSVNVACDCGEILEIDQGEVLSARTPEKVKEDNRALLEL